AAGSIPFGLLVVMLLGKGDVRAQGSGNIGATNVSRVAGKGVGLAVLLLDAAKGFLPVFLACRQDLPLDLQAAVALAAVLGHVFTPWLGFRGGKGVATALGAALAYRAPAVVPSFIAFVLLLGVFRYVSLGSVVGAALLPVAMGWPRETLHRGEVLGLKLELATKAQDPWQATLFWALVALIVIAKHHENLRRLLKGTESKLWGGKKGEATDG
ncbi:MAG TPA: glycerol-3-phosphate 1-O-acyltransferase PlsY, partial [Holophagaceae bacterium]|nr:glycerol-3-phosphate 1-O-acyltransferase PlsY [Holophagaceae bacterium]